MRYFWCVFLLFLMNGKTFSQTMSREQYPVFKACKEVAQENKEACFNHQVQDFFYNNFKVPDELVQQNYKGTVIALFEVDTTGAFKPLYIDAAFPELTAETKRVFAALDKVEPAKYAGKPTYAKYTIHIAIPLVKPAMPGSTAVAGTFRKTSDVNKELEEFDKIVSKPFQNPQFKSNLNIPFTHQNYMVFDAAVNQVGSNNHSASKPYSYAEVAKYYDFEAEQRKLLKNKTSWWGRKLWNENMAAIQGDDYWFTINPIFDLRLGKDFGSDLKYTYVNTRGLQVQGAIGEQLSFSTSVYESQGRFADYYNAYAESIKPSGGNPAIIPGIGIAKEFRTDAYDFPMAEANLTYTPNKFINLQLGYGRNFIGDGYRSLLLSDAASPYPYFKINTTFWKIKYTNTYMWLKDVRNEVTDEKTYATKYMANHYLSWNVTKRFNLGFFESVIWSNTNDRGFDFNFVNPIIFYRAVEFSSSSKSGNAVLGLTSKYKLSNQFNLYGQFLLDEFSLGDVKEGNDSWKNKYGFQLGAKYYDAFKVKNLLLQLEYNHVRPYVYAHSNVLTNYGHNNQSMGHLWGGNFKEVVAIAKYYYGRWFADAKLIYGQRGLDFNTADNTFNYGGNIYRNYDENRPYDSGVVTGQGNKTNVLIGDFQAGYLVNPAMNLKFFGNIIYRNFDPMAETATTLKNSTTWFSVGLRADLFNWYYDY